MDDTGLDDILEGETDGNDAPPVDEPAEAPAEPEAKGDDDTEPPAVQEKPEPRTVPLDALLDERGKRQALEARLQEIEAQKQAPDFKEDPEAWREHIEQTVESRLADERVNMSMEIARSAHTDFEDVIKAFAEIHAEDPGAYDRAVKSSNPGETAYRMCKQHLFRKEVGDDPAAYKDKLKAEILAELKGEQKPKVTLPSSLATVPNTAGRTDVPDNEPTPLEDILPKT